MKMKLAFAGFAGSIFTALVIGSAASAATCTINSVSFTLVASSAATCVAGNDLGNNGIVANDLAFFGLTGWGIGDSTDASAGDGSVTFGTDVPIVNASSGLWSVASYNGYNPLMIVLKSGPQFAAFLLTEAISGLSGRWNISEQKCNRNGCRDTPKALSHASVYYNGAPAPVPLPTAGLLLLGALGGLAALRRKRRSA